MERLPGGFATLPDLHEPAPFSQLISLFPSPITFPPHGTLGDLLSLGIT
jgi:hypothetical protein